MRAHAVIADALEDELEDEHDLPLMSYEVLSYLDEAPEQQLRMQELAQRLPLTKSGLTRLIDRMEDAGLIERRSCPTDRRGVHAGITLSGRVALEQAGEAHLRVLNDRFATHLDDRQLRELRDSLEKVATSD